MGGIPGKSIAGKTLASPSALGTPSPVGRESDAGAPRLAV